MSTEMTTEKSAEDIFAEIMNDQPAAAGKAPDLEEPQNVEQEAAGDTVSDPAATDPHSEDAPGDDGADETAKKLARLAELEQHYEKLSRDHQALHGRLAPMQRRVAELEHAMKASSAASPTPPKAPSTSTDQSLPDVLKPLEDDYPEIAGVIKAEREQSRREIAELKSRMEQMGAQFEPVVRQVGFQTEVQRLTQAHPDWQEINESEDFQGFVSWWWENQPPAFRHAIGGDQGLAAAFNQADFAIPLLNQFKQVRAQAKASVPTPPQTKQPNARNGQRAISAAPNVRSSGLPPAVDMSALPEEEQFALLMAQAGIR